MVVGFFLFISIKEHIIKFAETKLSFCVTFKSGNYVQDRKRHDMGVQNILKITVKLQFSRLGLHLFCEFLKMISEKIWLEWSCPLFLETAKFEYHCIFFRANKKSSCLMGRVCVAKICCFFFLTFFSI